MGLNILLVEDERNLARSIGELLTAQGHEVALAFDGNEGLRQAELSAPDLLLLDARLPGLPGPELLRRARAMHPALPAVVFTAYASVEDAVAVMKLGAFEYLQKPLDLDRLRMLVDRVEETVRLRQELAYYRSLDEPVLLGESTAIRSLREKIDQLGRLDGGRGLPTVLLSGETGTGKDVVARLLHHRSSRRNEAFLSINCVALPESLVEAELFGYERGAFTGASFAKLGLMEAADKGTLFLDEIGDLPLALQGKLLTAIERKTVRRLGSVRDRKVDPWILAATNRSLESLVREGAFRADLYYRLRVVHLELPPLRERTEDIPLLANHFLRVHGSRYGKGNRTLAPDAVAALQKYPWPGNVRELSHAVEQAVLWSKGEILGAADFAWPGPPAPARREPPRSCEEAIGWLLREGLPFSEIEKRLLQQALEATRQNVSQAARQLGMTRDILRYRMEKHGIAVGERS
ncbi:Two component, sigma54 specific, transcriptional regulator, Fis family [Methylacidimicrobium sp. AP8]|uniref:sigma-54-dependent transcriptional regulator n=1 Tax=Methylacidimicrobium sp. AP8 TaxID=2730359 RepID=UPI0018BF962B|nr:sigma-54 dependent transcriptional regulator [Methylacidimicrobium sp. AP8]CAB4244037.1 Two component, sigma54 specific, transcriptional regulator, Fis family [Methylacidimicrobium sp. AP8]